MKSPPWSWFWRSAPAGVFVAVVGSSSAQLPLWSPFQTRDAAIAMRAAELPLEYHGFVQTSDGLQFWVRDRAKKAGAFVKLGVAEPEIRVIARHFDAEQGTLTVERDGHTFILPERKAKILPARMPPRMTEASTAQAILAQEEVRLAAIVADIERRRVARAQADQSGLPVAKK